MGKNVYKLAQGDQRKILFDLTMNGQTLTSDALTELEVCAADNAFRKLMSAGEVGFDENIGRWVFLLTQEETLALEPGTYTVQARPEFTDGTVIMIGIGSIRVEDAHSEEVI